MAPQKRKKPHDEGSATDVQAHNRRTTRHTTTATTEPERQLRSGRVRANTLEKPPITKITPVPPPLIGTDASKAASAKVAATIARRTKENTPDVAPEPSQQQPNNSNKENTRPLPTRTRQTAVPPPKIPTSPIAMRAMAAPTIPSPIPKPATPAAVKPVGISTTPIVPAARPQTRVPPPKPIIQSRPQVPAAALTDPAAASAITPNRRTSISAAPKPPPTPRSDRNIDKVVLGNICFRAWYPSYYGKDVLGDMSGNAATSKEPGGPAGQAKIGGGKKDKEIMLDRLYVCPCCFKYSKELLSWSEHVKFCEKNSQIPGTKVYTHPKGSRVARTAAAPVDSQKKKPRSKSDAAISGTPGQAVIQDQGEWSVWEVDGERDVLFCQNLSLFAKLFLDNKSVFFDVTGFNYFLLVYTPGADSEGTASPPRPQITGFFSKEKLSWDNNNLACILVFPPWQRKGLGALLMGVSYEISRREGVLGGPEKPISDLGRKGYKRFWAGEIARWLLSIDLATVPESTRVGDKKEILVDVEECSQATWIVQEDCLVVLRDMGIIEEAGMGPPRVTSKSGDEEEAKEVKEIPRVKVDQEAVRRWIQANKIDLQRTCDPDGFVEGYAMKPVDPGVDESTR
ncbi:acyl-CoA N-acyltransferase [Xylariales sp. PMI_506]|nr:acyl-CoA N-acyltransferase [Xylariales sp. PMI_506]